MEAYGQGAQFSNNYVNYWQQVQDAYENMHTYEESENAKRNTNEYGLPDEGQNGKGDGGIVLTPYKLDRFIKRV